MASSCCSLSYARTYSARGLKKSEQNRTTVGRFPPPDGGSVKIDASDQGSRQAPRIVKTDAGATKSSNSLSSLHSSVASRSGIYT
jgi:hypothetical protein